MNGIIHFCQNPLGAHVFIEPLVADLCRRGVSAELWVEVPAGKDADFGRISVPKRRFVFDFQWRIWRMINGYYRIKAALIRLKPSVVHSHQTRASLIPLWAAKAAGVPERIYHNHGLTYGASKQPKRAILRWIERLNIAAATRVLFVSRSTMDLARSDGLLGKDDGAVPGNGTIAGIDLDDYRPELFTAEARELAKEKFGFRSEDFVVGYVGRPVPHKGFPGILRIWEGTRASRSGARLLLAGCAAAKVAESGGGPSVIGLGRVADMKGFYAACDVIALPSYTEGYPYALLEGAAAGCALVGYDVPGTRCAIVHGCTGELITAGDSAEFSAALDRLCLNRGQCMQYGASARVRIEREYSRSAIIEQMWEYYVRNGLVP